MGAIKAIWSFVDGWKTHLLVIVFVALQILNGGSLDALAKPEELGPIVLALAISALRSGAAKITAKIEANGSDAK